MDNTRKQELDEALNQTLKNMEDADYDLKLASVVTLMYGCMHGDTPAEDREYIWEFMKKILRDLLEKGE